MDSYKINYGKKQITFLLERKTRKSLKITVNPDKSVVAIAPEKIPINILIALQK